MENVIDYYKYFLTDTNSTVYHVRVKSKTLICYLHSKLVSKIRYRNAKLNNQAGWIEIQ